MPEVGNIFPKNAPEQLNKMTQGLNNTNDATNKLLETTKQLAEVLKQSNITYVKITEAQKGAVKVSQELTTVENQVKKNAEKINELNTNRAKTIAAQKVALQAKNKELKDSARLEAANTKVQKENIIVAKAQKGAYDAITAALTKNVAKWKSLTKEERENTSAGQKLTAAIKRQDAELKKLDSTIGRSQRNVGNYGAAIKGVASNLLGAFGVVGGVAMFARVMKDAFGTLRSFTKETAVLAGVLGKTREEVEELTKQAIALGSVYPVTASEVVKLQVSFARLGFTMSEIQDLTEATIQGSIALNAELDATATLVGAVVKAYSSLGTSDAQLIIDQLTIATQKSSLSFSSLETALPKVASAASALNVPLSKTLSLLGIAQDATLDASVSGTSLRNIFLEISKEGITLDEALEKINTSSNRLTASYDLFGKRGAIVGLALADNTEKIGEFDEAIQNAGGTAESVAKEQMDTLDGSIKNLGSSWEKLILGFRGSEGALSGVTNFFTNIIDGITNANAAVGPTSAVFWATLFGFDNKVREESIQRVKEFHKISKEELQKGLLAQQKLRQEARSAGDSLAEREATLAVIRISRRIEDIEKVETEAATKKKNAENEASLVKLALERESAEKIAEERKKAEKKANKEIEAERERHFKELRKSNEDFVADAQKTQRGESTKVIEEQKKRIDSQDKLETDKLAKRSQQQIDNTAQGLKDLEQAEQDRLEAISLAGEAANSIASALSDRKIANLQKEFDVLMLQKEAELAQEGLTAEQKQAIEEKFAKQAAEIKTKQAKAEKRAALVDVAINTAVAVSKVFGQTGIFGLAASIPIIAMGVLQAGIIASQPIPEFAEGTQNTPSEFIAGEKGRERMTLSTGEVIMVDKPTHFKGKKYQGATIDNNAETEKIMSQAINQGNINFDTEGLRDDIKSLHKTIKNKPVFIVDKDHNMIGEQVNNSKNIYLNKLMRK